MSEFSRIRVPDENPSGFCFENVLRNEMIGRATAGNGLAPLLSAKKTGTTIVGVVFDSGVVLGADTRATNDTVIAEKNCEKIHYIADNIYCCGAGTAADTEKTTDLISSQLELLRMNSKSQSRVITACTLLKRMLFRYQGHISAALVLGGCDIDGPQLHNIAPHGSTYSQPYTTMGSGSLAAMAVFESEWHEDLDEKAATDLVKKAILAGIFNDLGSGSNCDTTVIRMDGSVTVTRGAVKPNEVRDLRENINRSSKMTIPRGTTSVLKSSFVPFTLADVTVTQMDTDS
uniref:Proteasome subunit beta n=1 Tax=Corethron hystrix TaxID=216773 RepID=A0A7S1BNM7_9STRA|mmetsp:Transcript_3524/g.6516  ORF Transcript_3524/g.6516 Transcript_3524/m.6516 type:complete len:288 (+) Transcript_3524:258-1121(+)|eukprot:CAMPEP_0113310826 /NCGR_PEP_ID=MMETSP0010_2-20120614/8317_1 /TAXON_ID=216773 ORGANISM="Corethron hystrix, Strain 308" /NCGR_SAMPLE_ID=MMETSP0010_2 /ASSEMBLY_ACC=CAM_ASM_000155 /LENGTH=287 /DNA_ID=CAMNT_0000166361 /DNA_START=181 /DNA_END=1044 /DNA_ORIENTATION=+ /assembly_acc=CAM_ASM_000155